MFLYHTFIGDTKERAHFSVRDGKRQKETLGYDMERFLPEKLPNRGDTWVWSSSKYLTSENVKKKKERRKRGHDLGHDLKSCKITVSFIFLNC